MLVWFGSSVCGGRQFLEVLCWPSCAAAEFQGVVDIGGALRCVLLVSVGRPLHFVVNELLSWSERDSSRLACPLLKVLFRLPTLWQRPTSKGFSATMRQRLEPEASTKQKNTD